MEFKLTINEKVKLSEYGYNILQIETIAKCNMACSFCPYPLKDDKESILAVDEIKRIINQIDTDDKEFKYVTFSQFNEPLLDHRIFDLIDYAQQRGLKVLLITNGLLLKKPRILEGILRLKPDIKISLQILDENKHKDGRGVKVNLDDYLNIIVGFCKEVKNQPINVTIDIGSNFNDTNVKLYLKKILGFETGDPSIPTNIVTTIRKFQIFMRNFYDISDNEYKDKLFPLCQTEGVKNFFSISYLNQEGFKLYKNVTLKIKVFHYGRNLTDFRPRNEKFSCNTGILGVLSDGNIVPCCLSYDDSISLGTSYNKSLKNILDGSEFLKNLRDVNGEKHLTCRKCMGEPTHRGVFLKNLFSNLPFVVKNSQFVKLFKNSIS